MGLGRGSGFNARRRVIGQKSEIVGKTGLIFFGEEVFGVEAIVEARGLPH